MIIKSSSSGNVEDADQFTGLFSDTDGLHTLPLLYW